MWARHTPDSLYLYNSYTVHMVSHIKQNYIQHIQCSPPFPTHTLLCLTLTQTLLWTHACHMHMHIHIHILYVTKAKQLKSSQTAITISKIYPIPNTIHTNTPQELQARNLPTKTRESNPDVHKCDLKTRESNPDVLWNNPEIKGKPGY
jgi:hypothetical protein